MTLDYPNFKDACAGHGTRARAYMKVWSAMRHLQDDEPTYCRLAVVDEWWGLEVFECACNDGE